jgi:hypothetical protein
MVALIFSKFQDKTQAEKSKETPKAKQNKNAWLSRSLVLVLDTENRLILTGGTQPTCHESSLFRQAVKTITTLRIGEEFAEVIDNCNKEFADRAIRMTQSESIEKTEQLSGLKASKIEELKLYNRAVGSVTEARRADPPPSPSWGSEARALEGMKQGGFPD